MILFYAHWAPTFLGTPRNLTVKGPKPTTKQFQEARKGNRWPGKGTDGPVMGMDLPMKGTDLPVRGRLRLQLSGLAIS